MKYPRNDYPLTLLYDGACPICRLEMDRLAQLDGLRRLVFVDVAVPGFDAAPYGATLEDMQRLIHAVRPDGTLVVGVEVFRLAYSAVGWGLLFAPTALPGVSSLAERAYAVFARNRYRVSALLQPLLARMAAAQAARRTANACAGGVCASHEQRKAS
jgi:predicted DCC family thiol-disulfide oxidoreductase YuxK